MSHSLSVVAIIAAFNEADVVAQVVGDLIDQGVQVYVIDDGSTDDTVARVEPFVGKGVLAVEPFGADPNGRGAFRWADILRRKAALARELHADWFIHHDADEFRESPWEGVRLIDAIERVDRAGYNAIDFLSLDFWPDTAEPAPREDVRRALPCYAASRPHDRVQVRCWKRADVDVDLVSSGGHDATFDGRRVFPVRFISRHYPVRSEAHGRQKVFVDRRDRYLASERREGWHVQYDDLDAARPIVGSRGPLQRYDPVAVRLDLVVSHRGVEALRDDVRRLELAGTELRAALKQGEAEVARARQAEASARAAAEAAALNEAAALKDAEAERHRREGAEAALAASRSELDAAAQQIDGLHAVVGSLTTKLDLLAREAEAERAQLSGALEESRRLVDDTRQTLRGVETRLDDIQRSRSWRWTAIFRWLTRGLVGR